MTDQENQVPAKSDQPAVFRCGTLEYTKIGLMSLFVWLLWGDFCFTLMETIVPSIVPLKLKNLDCPNWVIGVIMTTVPNIFSMTLTPYISVKSDRCRSRWGRRIPFILASMPFLCLSLVLLGWSSEISAWLSEVLPMLKGFAPTTVAIGLIALLMVAFQFFNQFVNSTFYYLFNDVVPQSHLGRFSAAFRIVGILASTLYQFFVFKYALTHTHEIFFGATLLYGIGFGMMCLMIKEGQYPPLDAVQAKKVSRFESLALFFRESFQERFYQLLFISAGVLAFAGVAWGFQVFFLLEMKMNMEQNGYYNGILGVAAFIATYFAAVYVDRWHPLRVYTYGIIFNITGPLMNWVWLFIDLPGATFFYLSLGAQLLYAFMNALSAACAMPLTMRLFPRTRYGQICSARGIVVAFCTIVAGFVVGGFYDLVRIGTSHLDYAIIGKDYCYRFYFFWSGGATLINFVLIAMVYRLWLKKGGDAGFHPPAPWTEEGFEHVEIVPTTGYLSKYLKIALYFMDFVMYGSLALAAAMIIALRRLGMTDGAFYFTVLVLPASVLVAFFWYRLSHGIRTDVERAKRGEMPRNGIPHHGMMMVFGIKFALTIGLVVAQLVVSIRLHNDLYAVLFAMANVVTNVLLIFCTYVITRMERGFAVRVDEASVVKAGFN
ncbi:MAG: MFS transporter [Victivallaceae bacterium]